MMKKVAVVCTMIVFISLVMPLDTFTQSTQGETVEGMVVDEGESLSYSDQQLIVEGDMNIEGSLSLKNVDLILNDSEGNTFEVKKTGSVDIKNSEIMSYQNYVRREIAYNLSEGLNMISIPFIQNDTSIESVLSPLDGYYDKVLYYDSENDRLRRYKPYDPPQFNDLNDIDESMGIAINITQDINITMEGCIPQTIERTLYDPENMMWDDSNWISFPFTEPKIASNVFSVIQDDIDSIKTLTEAESGNDEETVLPTDKLYPGKGYKLKMKNTTNFTYDIPYGISRNRAASLDSKGGIDLVFEEGSSGDILDTKITGSGSEQGIQDVSVRSNSVKIERCTFRYNNIGIKVEESNPIIRDNTFESYVRTGIDIETSSPMVESNDFSSETGWAINILRGSPDIFSNSFNGVQGIRLEDSNGVIQDNNISDLSSRGVYAIGGAPIVESNMFSNNKRSSIRTESSNMTVMSNTFIETDGAGAAFLEGGSPSFHKNTIEGGGYGVQVKDSKALVYMNDISEVSGWGAKVIESENASVSNNTFRRCSSGISLSGTGLSVYNNIIEKSERTGIETDNSTDMTIRNNIVEDNDGPGIFLSSSYGAIFDNNILDNYGGIKLLDSSPQISNNTIANNRLFGISVTKGAPLIDNNVISGNKNSGLKCDESSPMIRGSSISGSEHHLYLISSNVTAINSFLLEEKVWMTVDSTLTILNRFEVGTEEDKKIEDYPLIEKLPPGASIKGYDTDHNITIRERNGHIDFTPPPDKYGRMTVNFEISVSGQQSYFPVTLNVTPVNDPPEISEQNVTITYKPNKVTWTMIYTDADNQLPSSVEVVIDGDAYPMKEANESDHNTSNGKEYYYEKYLEPGDHEYYFIAKENNTLGKDITRKTTTRTVSLEPNSVKFSNLIVITIMALIMAFLLIVGVYYSKNKKEKLDGLEGGSDSKKELKKLKKREEESPVDLVEKLERELNSLSNNNKEKRGLKNLRNDKIRSDELAADYGAARLQTPKIKSLPVLHKRRKENGKRVEKGGIIEGEEDGEGKDEGEEKEDTGSLEKGEEGRKGTRTDLVDIVGDVEDDEGSIVEEEPEDEEGTQKDTKKKHRVIRKSKKETIQKKKRVVKGDMTEKTEDHTSSGNSDIQKDELSEGRGLKKRNRVIKE